MNRPFILTLLLGIFAITGSSYGAVVTFENLTPTIAYTGPGGGFYENGPNMTNASTSTGDWGETIYHNVFSSGDASLSNHYVPSWPSWDSWSYSNTTDTTTAGNGNQYSAVAGGGADSSANYGVFFEPFGGIEQTVAFGGAVNLGNVAITNTTYAYKAVVNGDDGGAGYVTAFGQDDWFKLTVWGFDAGGAATTSLDIYLADYREAGNWYALNTWTDFNLSGLGTVYGLGFGLNSTDMGDFGMNTPGYFAMDNLEVNPVPIPASVLLFGSGLLGLFGIRRKRNG